MAAQLASPLTVREVAKRLGVCTAVVYALVSKGELSHVRVSNAIRVAPSDLDAFLKAGRPQRSRRPVARGPVAGRARRA